MTARTPNLTYGTNLESEENGEELSSITDKHAVTDARQLFLHGIFDWHWRYVLSTGGYQDL